MPKSYGITGKECEAELELLSSNESIGKIIWFQACENPDDYKVLYKGRTSVLAHASGKKIIGAEHLSAAALMFPGCQFKLNAPQGELPLLDGSAKLWEEELKRAGGVKRDSLVFYDIPEREFCIENEGSFVKFRRAEGKDCLEIIYIIERFGRNFSTSVKINSAKDLEKILLARTYIFEEELPQAGLSENLRGCGVVLCREENNLLFENEPAFHKILDFLGDITLYAGTLPRGKFEIYNGGHELNHSVLGKIR